MTINQDSSPGMIEVSVGSHSEVDAALDEVIGTVRNAATHHQIGIMITRTGPGQYIVRTHPAVPFGLIRQHQ